LSWGHNYLTYNAKCVDSPGEAISNYEIFRRLAARMGYTDEQFTWSDSKCLEHYIDWDSPACEGFDLNYLREHGYARLNLGSADERAPHKEGNFPTPTGKCEFLSTIAPGGNFVAGPFRQMYEDMQGGEYLDELPDYVAPRETPATNPVLAKKYPLNIISPKSHGFLNSCYANMKQKIKGQGEQFVLINAADASSRGIKNGDVVRVFNDRGAFEGAAEITEDVNNGIIVATLGYWRQLTRGTVNIISSAEFANMGHAPSFSDNLVEVEVLG
jgi:anaerobic selenocysteine-containing dehydrogenase